MTKTLILGTLALVGLAGAAQAATLDDVKAAGTLNCGVNPGLTGFATPDASGRWEGFDVDLCRAIAAVVFNDPEKVTFTPLSGETRFTALAAGEVDLLARNSTWTFSRDTDLSLEFVAVNYFDGQGFLVPTALGVTSATELDGATVCIQTGTTTELNLADFFRVNNITYEPVPIANDAEGRQQYLAGACDTYTTDASGLAAARSTFEAPDEHVILPEIISKEPLGPAVRQGDHQWADLVRWTFYALVAAEELGITQANVEEQAAAAGNNPEINRLLGTEDELGSMMGVDPQWAVNAIKAVGNYGEIFDRHLGPSTALAIERGLNAQWTQGGLMYAPPFR